jgi:hypothetical protein
MPGKSLPGQPSTSDDHSVLAPDGGYPGPQQEVPYLLMIRTRILGDRSERVALPPVLAKLALLLNREPMVTHHVNHLRMIDDERCVDRSGPPTSPSERQWGLPAISSSSASGGSRIEEQRTAGSGLTVSRRRTAECAIYSRRDVTLLDSYRCLVARHDVCLRTRVWWP